MCSGERAISTEPAKNIKFFFVFPRLGQLSASRLAQVHVDFPGVRFPAQRNMFIVGKKAPVCQLLTVATVVSPARNALPVIRG